MRSLIILFLLNVTTFCLHSQEAPSLLFDHFGQKEGFTAKSSRGIIKGKDGFMYIASERGLAKYDGHSFEFFESKSQDSFTFNSNYLTALAEDDYGRIWVISNKDLDVFDTKTKKVTQLYNGKKEKYRPHSLFFDTENKTMWVGAHDGLYYTKGKVINLIKSPITANDNLENKGHEINKITADKNGDLWCAHRFGLNHINTKTFKLRRYTFSSLPHVEKDNSSLMTVYVDDDSIIWAGSYFYGLYKLDVKTGVEKKYNFSNSHQGVMAITKSKYLGTNYLWVATVEGLFLFDIKLERFYKYRSDDFSDKTRLPASTWDFYEDGGALWIGTHFGLHKYDYKKQNITKQIIPKILEHQDLQPRATAMEKIDKILWIHYPYYRTMRYNTESKEEIAIPTKIKKYFDINVGIFTLYIDQSNILYIATNEYGLIAYDITNDKLIIEGGKYFNKKNEWVFEVSETKSKILLTTYKGFYTFDRNSTIIKEENKINNVLFAGNNHFLKGVIDYKDKYWVLTSNPNGKYFLYLMTSEGKVLASSVDQKTDLGQLGELNQFRNDKNGNALIAAYNGLALITINDNFRINLKIINKEMNSIISHYRQVEIDKYNNLWASTNFGISYFDFKKNTVKEYSFMYTSLGPSENPNIFYDNNSDRLLVFQPYGYDIVVNNNSDFNIKSIVHPTKIMVNNTIIDDIHALECLPYHENDLYFEFSLLDFTDPDKHRYFTMLEGVDYDWKYSTNNYIHYNKLASGKYTLHIKAINAAGNPSSNTLSIHFAIAYPYYRTWWFIVLVASILAFVMYAIFRYRELQKEKLDKMRLRIAQDLHDDLGSNLSNIKLMSEIEMMKSEDKDRLVYKDIASQTKQVMENMSEIVWSINPMYDALNIVIEKIVQQAIESLEKRNIDVVFEIDEIRADIKLSPDTRRQYFLTMKEIINNCAKYSEATEVRLNIQIESSIMKTTFTDNGKGFDIKNIKRGNGLNNIASRIENLGGKLSIESKEEVGTTIKFDLPLK